MPTGRKTPKTIGLNGVASNESKVSFGIPKGSVLGPVLFSIFINDLPECLRHSCITLYADDSSLHNHNLNELQSDLNPVSRWCLVNKLTLNHVCRSEVMSKVSVVFEPYHSTPVPINSSLHSPACCPPLSLHCPAQ